MNARRTSTAAAFLAVLCAAAGAGNADPNLGRARALIRIARSGRPDVPAVLIRAATDPAPLIRRTALQCIEHSVRRPNQAAKATLRAALRDPHPLVVLAGCEALRVHRDPAAARGLAGVVRHPPAFERRHALPDVLGWRRHTSGAVLAEQAFRALDRLPWAADVQIVLDLLVGRDVPGRVVAARTAAGLADKLNPADRRHVVAALAGNLRCVNVRVARSAAEALVAFDDPRGTGVLIDGLCRPTFLLRRTRAVACLEKLTARKWGADDPAFWAPGDRRDPARRDAVARRIAEIAAAVRSRGWPTEPPDVFPKKLTAADKALLGRAMAVGLFDPRGCRRVHAKGGSAPQPAGFLLSAGGLGASAFLWQVPPGQPRPAGLYDPWGRKVTGVESVEPLKCPHEALLAEATGMNVDWGFQSPRSLVAAAWLFRLGEEEHAARLLCRARGLGATEDELLDRLRGRGAFELALGAAAAYAHSDDDAALAGAELARKVGGPGLFEDYGVEALARELRRRRQAGTFGRTPQPLPEDLGSRPVGNRIALLVRALEDVAVPPDTPGGPADLSADPRVMGLIEIGDPAVGALIDCVQTDSRLTRTVCLRSLPRGLALGVREAALGAVQSILRKSFFEPESAFDCFTRHGPEAAATVARRLRAYWAANRNLPLGRRMMNVLLDRAAAPGELRVAAKNLAALGGVAIFGTMEGTSRLVKKGTGPSPAVRMFANPTAAEAILDAMDRDLAAGRGDPRRADIEILYARALAALGDRRIAGKLLERYLAPSDDTVREAWAVACDHLGRPEALEHFRAVPTTQPAGPSRGR